MDDELSKIILEVQARCSKEKEAGTTITCPFLWADKESVDICEVCHAWMGTTKSKDRQHPCNFMLREKILEVFWRKPVRICRVCGCTDEWCPACIKKLGHPCHWVEDDLCSACVEEAELWQ